MLPVVLYGHGTWSPTLREDFCECYRSLRKIFGSEAGGSNRRLDIIV